MSRSGISSPDEFLVYASKGNAINFLCYNGAHRSIFGLRPLIFDLPFHLHEKIHPGPKCAIIKNKNQSTNLCPTLLELSQLAWAIILRLVEPACALASACGDMWTWSVLFRPPDIVCRWTYILHVFLSSSFFLSSFFRRLIFEVAERNSTKIGHMVGSKCNLKTHVQHLGHALPLQIRGPKTTFLDDFAT